MARRKGYTKEEILEKTGKRTVICMQCGKPVYISNGKVRTDVLWINTPHDIYRVYCSLECKRIAQRKIKRGWK